MKKRVRHYKSGDSPLVEGRTGIRIFLSELPQFRPSDVPKGYKTAATAAGYYGSLTENEARNLADYMAGSEPYTSAEIWPTPHYTIGQRLGARAYRWIHPIKMRQVNKTLAIRQDELEERWMA